MKGLLHAIYRMHKYLVYTIFICIHGRRHYLSHRSVKKIFTELMKHQEQREGTSVVDGIMDMQLEKNQNGFPVETMSEVNI